jgi:hypothetical protein
MLPQLGLQLIPSNAQIPASLNGSDLAMTGIYAW